MKLPRGVFRDPVRHPGPHMQFLSVPLHNPRKTGTLPGIIVELALMQSMTTWSLAELL
ncbi:MAG: hypothetical protein ABJF23_14160 [Bryobacteraceae bacterium]